MAERLPVDGGGAFGVEAGEELVGARGGVEANDLGGIDGALPGGDERAGADGEIGVGAGGEVDGDSGVAAANGDREKFFVSGFLGEEVNGLTIGGEAVGSPSVSASKRRWARLARVLRRGRWPSGSGCLR
ncbi:MAG: hypothetical protein ACRD96_10475, partial [Bryobacteraceae bacterium]